MEIRRFGEFTARPNCSEGQVVERRSNRGKTFRSPVM
jgi:hypothetical protein